MVPAGTSSGNRGRVSASMPSANAVSVDIAAPSHATPTQR